MIYMTDPLWYWLGLVFFALTTALATWQKIPANSKYQREPALSIFTLIIAVMCVVFWPIIIGMLCHKFLFKRHGK